MAFEDLELEPCPLCRGTGILEEEQGWCVYAACLDCGCRTAELTFSTPEERLKAAQQAAHLWNIGKVVHTAAMD